MKSAILLLVLGTQCSAAIAQDDAMPFGPIGDAELKQFAAFSKSVGFDLEADMERAYTDQDEAALGRLFRLSLAFKTLDGNARAYGQITFSSLLNLGEVMGVEAYVQVLDRQPAEVQQRVRDFLYYPTSQLGDEDRRAEEEEETRRIYPSLFPKDYRFGLNDPIFKTDDD